MGPGVHHNPYHVSILRSQLTRNIGTLYPEIRNEIVTALDDVLDLRGNGEPAVMLVHILTHECLNTQNGSVSLRSAPHNRSFAERVTDCLLDFHYVSSP